MNDSFPGKRQADIWLIAGEPEAAACARYETLLSQEEKERYHRFLHREDRQRFLLTRAAIRTLLSHYHPAIAPADWSFSANRHGKPAVSNQELMSPLHFSISHSQGLIAIAISGLPVLGVDVENMQLKRRIPELALRYFAESESAALLALPEHEQKQRFFDLWTLKEAYVKACGLGLTIPLKHFAFSFAEQGEIIVRFLEQRQDDPSAWLFRQYDCCQHYRLALAVKNEGGAGFADFTVTTGGWHPDFGTVPLDQGGLSLRQKSRGP